MILYQDESYIHSCFKISQHDSHYPALLLFMSKYKVPWILKWHYSITANTVTQQFLVKWWPKFDHQRIIAQVKVEFATKVPTPVKITGLVTNTPPRVIRLAMSALRVSTQDVQTLPEKQSKSSSKTSNKL